jgi:hypothetical protein
MHTGAQAHSTRRAGTVERAVLLAERARWAAAWAETHAERGDFEYALRWLEVVRRSSGGLSRKQRADREVWRSELNVGRSA